MIVALSAMNVNEKPRFYELKIKTFCHIRPEDPRLSDGTAQACFFFALVLACAFHAGRQPHERLHIFSRRLIGG
jgi:hypothetical protein